MRLFYNKKNFTMRKSHLYNIITIIYLDSNLTGEFNKQLNIKR